MLQLPKLPTRSLTLDLREEAAARRPHLTDLPELTEAERGMAIRTWRGRMVNEHISARVFAGLVPQLMAAAIQPKTQALVADYIADEYRHAEQCAGVVLALGGDPIAPLPELPPVPSHPDATPLEAALRNILSICCLSETVAVAIIRAEQAELEGTELGRVLNSILADEVRHARFGWALLGKCLESADEDLKSRLSDYLVVALQHQVAYEVPKLPPNPGIRQEVRAAGVCDGREARDIFFATIERVILPQLEALGLEAKRAWRRAQAA